MSSQPGLDDDLQEAPAVPERLRLLRFAAGACEERHRHLDDPSAMTQGLDQDLAGPELVLLQDHLLEQIRPRRPEAGGGVGDPAAGQDRHDPREQVDADMADQALAFERSQETRAVYVIRLAGED